jgi:pimeloyl-ACP methyl ester carboxylesterase
VPLIRQVLPKSLFSAAAAGIALVAVSAAGPIGAAAYFARRFLTPDRLQPDDTQILGIDGDSIMLGLTPESGQPGLYGLWFNGGRGHARVGAILSVDKASGSVRRVLEGVDAGELRVGPARWDGYYFFGSPQETLGLPSSDVEIESDIGMLPAWEVPAPAAAKSLTEGEALNRWAILVHGRGAQRGECLRAVPVLHELGFTSLIPMYRNDIGAPSSSDGRYSLGLSEWRDCEAAILHAVDSGAQEIVLFGWSMGGAIVLQTLDRSWLSGRVKGVVLNAPALDWADVIRHQTALNNIPGPIGALSRSLIGQQWARRLVGVHEPIDWAQTNWESRADELKHRTLLIHSVDDDFVPVGPALSLATKRPDLVRFEPWKQARHTKEWNVDPQRWNAIVRDFLTD